MATRHKVFKASLDKGLASEWNDDHIIDFTVKREFVDTFLGNRLNAIWNYGNNTGAGSTTVAYADFSDWLIMDAGIVGDDIASAQLGDYDFISVNELPELTMALYIANNKFVEFGFITANTSPFSDLQNGSYFRVTDGELYAVTCDSFDETVTDLGIATEKAVYRIIMTPTIIYFYVNNMITPIAIHTTYIDEENYSVKLAEKAVTGITQIFRCQGVGLMRNRST